MNLFKSINDFRVRLFWKSIFYSYGKPVLLSLWALAIAYFISKIFTNELGWLFLVVPVIFLGIAFYVGHTRYLKIKFTESEMAALVDKKLQAGGTYMAFDENGGKQTSALHMFWSSKFADVSRIEANSIGSYFKHFLYIVVFFLIVFFAPLQLKNSFLQGNSKDILLQEKDDISLLDKLDVLNPEVLSVMKKELEDLSKEYAEKGLSKDVWEKKNKFKEMIEKAVEDQLNLEQQQLEKLSELAKDLVKGQELNELMNKLSKIDKELMQKNMAPDSGQKEFKDLMKNVSELAKDPKNKKLMEDMIKNMGDLRKKMEAQNNGLQQAKQFDPNNIKEAKIDKDAAEKLKELAKNLEKLEKAECKECEGGFQIQGAEVGDPSVSRGPGTADVKHNNKNNAILQNENKETVEVSNYFNSKGEVLSSAESEHQKAIVDKKKNQKIDYVDTKTDLIFKEELKPHRRKTIKEFFKTTE